MVSFGSCLVAIGLLAAVGRAGFGLLSSFLDGVALLTGRSGSCPRCAGFVVRARLFEAACNRWETRRFELGRSLSTTCRGRTLLDVDAEVTSLRLAGTDDGAVVIDGTHCRCCGDSSARLFVGSRCLATFGLTVLRDADGELAPRFDEPEGHTVPNDDVVGVESRELGEIGLTRLYAYTEVASDTRPDVPLSDAETARRPSAELRTSAAELLAEDGAVGGVLLSGRARRDLENGLNLTARPARRASPGLGDGTPRRAGSSMRR